MQTKRRAAPEGVLAWTISAGLAYALPVHAAAWDKPGWQLTFQYASGLLCSVHEQKYGYFEARLKVPAGQGMWPAFWILGNEGSSGVNEVDVHEILGNEPSKVYETLHWGTDYDAGHKSDGSSWVGPDFSADFHVFGLEWTANAIVWTIDGVERKRHTGEGIPQVEMYAILNLAIGLGRYPRDRRFWRRHRRRVRDRSHRWIRRGCQPWRRRMRMPYGGRELARGPATLLVVRGRSSQTACSESATSRGRRRPRQAVSPIAVSAASAVVPKRR